MEQILPQCLRRNQPCWCLDFKILASRVVREYIPVVLSLWYFVTEALENWYTAPFPTLIGFLSTGLRITYSFSWNLPIPSDQLLTIPHSLWVFKTWCTSLEGETDAIPTVSAPLCPFLSIHLATMVPLCTHPVCPFWLTQEHTAMGLSYWPGERSLIRLTQ